jgi:PTH1 family peptidyl-tRNA hydrolase
VRIGIGRPADPDENKDYLLRPMTSAERQTLESNLDRAASAVEALVESGLERAMNRYNQRG